MLIILLQCFVLTFQYEAIWQAPVEILPKWTPKSKSPQGHAKECTIEMKTALHHNRKSITVADINRWILIFALLVDIAPVFTERSLTPFQGHGLAYHQAHSRYRRYDQFQSQRNNLKGKPGQGYYLEMDIGTPPQKVHLRWNWNVCRGPQIQSYIYWTVSCRGSNCYSVFQIEQYTNSSDINLSVLCNVFFLIFFTFSTS